MSNTLANLITNARQSRNGTATAGNGWVATVDADDVVTVRHYATDMFAVSGWNSVRAIDGGRRSTSDVQGTNKILAGLTCESYRSLFG